MLGRDPCDVRDHLLDILHAHGFLAPVRVCQAGAGTGLVDHVDGGVRELAVREVARRKFHRAAKRRVGVADLMVFLESRFEPAQDLHGLVDGGFGDVYFLEPP